MCTVITFCWTRQLANATLIGPVAFRERELCVLVLHSVGADIYLTILSLGDCKARNETETKRNETSRNETKQTQMHQ